jgi:glycosyltransferase involved in cell wall biosynthesis
MNFWLLTGEYPPDYGGGIAAYSFHTVQMLRQRGHQLTVFAAAENAPGNIQVEESSEGVRVVRFGTDQSPQSSALGQFAHWSYDAALVLAGFCRKEGLPDALEVQEYLGMPYFLLQRRLALEDDLANLPVLVTTHTPLYLCRKYNHLPSYRFPGYWIGEMERFSMLAADEVVYPSNYLRNEIEKDLPQIGEHSRVIANPYQIQGGAIPELSNANRRGFLFTGRIERRKGIEALLTAFSKLWEAGLDEPLHLVGDDWFDELNQCKMSETIQKQHGRFISAGLLVWEGKQPPQVVRQRLESARAMILPSLLENYPYAVLEAMAAGCPVIVSDSGGHAELVEDGISGYVFSHQKAGDLEQKIKLICDLNRSEYERMISSARARVEQVSGYKAVAPQKEEALEWAREQVRPRKLYPFLRTIERDSTQAYEPVVTGEMGMLSVVIPFFNLGEYLEDTIKPFENLKDIAFEIIVMNDGSTDQPSLEKLGELKNEYHFRAEHSENLGLPAMRNIGAKLAKGEFLAFIDADDWMDPVFYQRAIEILRQYENVSFVGCWAAYYGDAGGYWPTWTPEPPYAMVHNPINTGALVYRRADFLRFGLNDPSFEYGMEDYDSMLNLLDNGRRGVVIPEPYFKYRVRNNSMFHSTTDVIKTWTYQQLARKHHNLYAAYADDIIGILNSNGPGYLYDNPTIWYPPPGFDNGSDLRPLNQGIDIYLSMASPRMLSYFLLRSLLIKPYIALKGRFPGLEKYSLKMKYILTRK